MTQTNKERYAVAIPTSQGNVIIESVEQWEKLKRFGEFIGLLNSNRIGTSNRVYASAIIANSPEDAEREVRGTD